jgi:O-antigen ligase
MKFFLGNKNNSIWELLIVSSLVLFLLFSFVSISVSQIGLALALMFFFIWLLRARKPFSFPSFFWFLIGYALFSFLAAIFSVNQEISLVDSRELLLFLVVPIVFSGFQKREEISLAHYALLGSALTSSLFSLFTYFFQTYPGERITGFMGHYMTQAGILLLFACFALSMVIHSKIKQRLLWSASLILALAALSLTLTRSAWVGFVVAATLILLLYRPKTLIVIPVLVALFLLFSPQPMKKRALSIVDIKSTTNKIRLEYIKAGIEIIKEYPLLGTGPDTVDMVFQDPKYGLSEEAKRNVHLHNNLVQIAAERGILTLLFWLGFIVWTFISLGKLRKASDPGLSKLTMAAMSAVTALFTAGLFEYNFADSEIAVLFLYIITLPFTVHRIQEKDLKSD